VKTPTLSAFQAVCLLAAIPVAGAALLALEGFQARSARAKQSRKPPSAATAKESSTAAIRLNSRGVGYMTQQRVEDALTLFRQAYALDPTLSVARLNEGIAQLNLQRIEAAREALIDAAQKQPLSARARYNLGLLWKNAGDVTKALEAFQKVSELDPNDADTKYFLGLLYAQVEQFEPAVAAFRAAIERNPFHASAEFGLARAYQRVGDAENAREHLARFQHLTQQKLGTPMGLAYGEQGPLSLAEEARSGSAVPPAIPVRFVLVPAEQSGLDMGRRSRSTRSQVCVLDYNNDGKPDLFVGTTQDMAGTKLFRNEGGHFKDVTEKAGLSDIELGKSCAAGDYDNDGWVDLAVGEDSGIRLFHNEGNGKFREVTKESGVGWPPAAASLLFVDLDHDGDLDLFAAAVALDASNPRILWRNNGNGTFTDWTGPAGLRSNEPSPWAVAADLNNDRAIDLLTLHEAQMASIFFNPREGKFKAETPWSNKAAAQGASDAAVLDFDHDGWMDIALVDMQPGITLWHNDHGRSFAQVPFPNPPGFFPAHIVAFDYDNDGWVDLTTTGCTSQYCGVKVFRNEGGGKFSDVSANVGSYKSWKEGHAPQLNLKAFDFDGDGDTDLLVAQSDGSVVLLRNDGGNKNNSLRVSLKAVADNKSAIGTKVEIFAGINYQKFEITTLNELLAGLGTEKQADVVRLLWPTGVVQDEVSLAAGRHEIVEMDRRGSSCPILFAWNGRRFEFIADMIGPGIVGHWVAPGERNVSDPTEYLEVPGESVRPRDGRLRFRFVEPMEEVVYLDQVRLLAVDHPGDVEVFPNEYFASAPPFPKFKVIASRGVRPPLGAWDDRGRSVLPELLARDRRYVAGFGSAQFKGFAKLHTLELDLGEWDARKPLRLLMHGFTDYFTATSVYAAHQAGVTPIAPYVEALDVSGQWVRVVHDMGFPAGLARTMVADLTGRLPTGTRRIRITTNLKVYWDQIRIDNSRGNLPFRSRETPLAAAALRFLGYPREMPGNPPADLAYNYERISRTGPYARAVGNYTRYGDVRSLLEQVDDRYVLFGSGDEVAIEFDAGGMPAPPAGWTRDYFFFADGFSKDMDFYAAYGDTVEPLPFHRMRSYPYPAEESYPQDKFHLDFQLDALTRGVSGGSTPSFRFDYRAKNRRR
jgi:tetratricopeptide (TPR) repeat protein